MLLTQDVRVGEDLAQEAFARVFPKWSRVDNPNAYLRVAVVNACRSWQSRRAPGATILHVTARIRATGKVVATCDIPVTVD